MADLNIAIKIAADDKASGPIGKINAALHDLGGTGQSLVSGGFKNLQTVGVAALSGLAVGATALAAGFGLAMKTAVDMNSTLETSTLQFTTLMGDAGRAEEHVKSLFEFAKKTPFETGPIIEASRMMRTFGGDVLDTEDNLKLVGDAAAATGAPIDELGFWVGRMYSNLQAGQPFGEAAMRLQELAVMSPQAREEMERLQKSGASADEIFAVMQGDMGKFTGAMEAQAGTWKGLVSTIKDSLAITAAGALKPFFDLAKEGLGAVAAFLSSPALTSGVEMFADRVESMGTVAKLFMDHLQSGMPFLDSFQIAITQVALVFGMAGPEARALGENIGLFLDRVITAVQPIWEFVQNNVQLSDVLTGLGVAIATVVLPALGSILVAVGPVILVFAAVVAAVAAVRTAWETDFGGMRTSLIEFWEVTAKPAFELLQQWLAVNVPVAIETLKNVWAAVWPVMQAAIAVYWDFTKFVWSSMWSFLTTVLIPIIQYLWTQWVTVWWPAISAALAAAWAIMQPILVAAWDYIMNTIIPTVQELWNKWVTVWWPGISAALQAAWAIMKPLLVAAWDYIVNTIVPAVKDFWTKWVTVWWPAISAALQTAWGIIRPIWETFALTLTETLPKALTTMRDTMEGVMTRIKAAIEPVHSAWKNLVDAVVSFWNWLTTHHFPSLPSGGGASTGSAGGDGGYASGGYTGMGAAGAVAGLVHRGEYVMNARAVRNLGVNSLEMLHQGAQRPLGSGVGDGASTSSSPRITLINPQFFGVENVDSFLTQLEGLS